MQGGACSVDLTKTINNVQLKKTVGTYSVINIQMGAYVSFTNEYNKIKLCS